MFLNLSLKKRKDVEKQFDEVKDDNFDLVSGSGDSLNESSSNRKINEISRLEMFDVDVDIVEVKAPNTKNLSMEL